MMLRRRISVKLYTLIIALSAPFLAFWILNGKTMNTMRLCDRLVRFSSHRDSAGTVDAPVRLVSFVEPTISSKMKTILYWTKSVDMVFGNGDVFGSCPVWKCIATGNRTALNVRDFDVILFRAQDMNRNDLPRQRSPSQLYVFHDLETQIFQPIYDDVVFRNFFNWTMTYRRDSTLMRPYGVVKTTDTNEYLPPHIPTDWQDISKGEIDEEARRLVQGKTKLVTWFASDCVTPSKREVYVKALKQHIPIDIFGECGSTECNLGGDHCFEMVGREYYFYLAFENSLCIDYITENVFEALRYNVVPVVYGAGDYRTVLPPGSYIDIRDFSKPKQLADYLWAVGQDPVRYLSFFKWKNHFKVEVKPEYYTVCELCKKLYEANRPPIVVGDIYDWWTTGQCLRKPTFRGIPEIDN